MSLNYQLSSLNHAQSVTDCNGTIATKLETEYGICLTRGFVCPVDAKPLLAEKRPTFNIADVDAVAYDPTRGEAFLRVHGPLDPIFSANIAEDAMDAADIISGRSSLRSLMAVVSPEISDAFYSRRKPFILLVEKIGRKLILKTETNYPEERGGFGQGFDDAVTTPSARGVDISGMDYFRVVSYTLGDMRFLTSHEVDCVHPTSGLSVELKSSKIKRNKRSGAIYNLTPDFYINVWRQMVLSGTPILKIGRHENGVVRNAVVSMTIGEVRKSAGITPAAADLYFVRLVEVLRWISSNTAEGQQALVEYSQGGRALDMHPLSPQQRRPCLSQSVRDKVSPPLQQPTQPAALAPVCDSGTDVVIAVSPALLPLPLPPSSAAAANAGAPPPHPVTPVTTTTAATTTTAVDVLASEGSDEDVNALADLVKKVL
jgi:hypothetical protein